MEFGRDGSVQCHAAIAVEITGADRDRIHARQAELAPGLERIRAEHSVVARLVGELRELLEGEHDQATLHTRVDRLTAELEAHFAYEEAQLAPALDAA